MDRPTWEVQKMKRKPKKRKTVGQEIIEALKEFSESLKKQGAEIESLRKACMEVLQRPSDPRQPGPSPVNPPWVIPRPSHPYTNPPYRWLDVWF